MKRHDHRSCEDTIKRASFASKELHYTVIALFVASLIFVMPADYLGTASKEALHVLEVEGGPSEDEDRDAEVLVPWPQSPSLTTIHVYR